MNLISFSLALLNVLNVGVWQRLKRIVISVKQIREKKTPLLYWNSWSNRANRINKISFFSKITRFTSLYLSNPFTYLRRVSVLLNIGLILVLLISGCKLTPFSSSSSKKKSSRSKTSQSSNTPSDKDKEVKHQYITYVYQTQPPATPYIPSVPAAPAVPAVPTTPAILATPSIPATSPLPTNPVANNLPSIKPANNIAPVAPITPTPHPNKSRDQQRKEDTLEKKVYSNASDAVKIRVLVFKGEDLNEEKNNISAKRNKVIYDGKQFPLKEDQTRIKVAKNKPLLFNGNQYHGDMIVMKEGSDYYLINELPIELYLTGVLRKEISHSWSAAAIEAQAIASRTYAYYKYLENHQKPYHLKGDNSDQIFAGTIGVNPTIIHGVDATQDEILTHKNYPVLTFFHAACGGQTERPENVWEGYNKEEKLPHLHSVRCEYCTTHPKYSWSYSSKYQDIHEKLSRRLNKNVRSFHVKSVSESGRIKEMEIITDKGKTIMSGNNFRLTIGATDLLSTKFKILRKGDTYMVEGTGYGHGVGLCQWGAKTLAESGRSARQILDFYYKDIDHSTIENVQKYLANNSLAQR